MSGSSSKGIVIGVLALVVVGAALWYSGVIGGKPAKEDDATAATDAATPATDTPAPAQPESPAGVPAPADTVIANFDGGSAQAPYGMGIKGDGQQYQMMVLSGTPMKMPPLMLGFTAGPEWQKYEFEIPKLGAADWKRV